MLLELIFSSPKKHQKSFETRKTQMLWRQLFQVVMSGSISDTVGNQDEEEILVLQIRK